MKARELQRRMSHAFEEYFGEKDPVFSSSRECEDRMNEFIRWYKG